MAEPIDSNWTQCLNKDMDVVHSALEESFHEEVVQTFPHVCEMCGKEYTTRSGLWKHRAGKHETEASNKRLTCAICNETFVNKGHLEGHVNMHHGLRSHVCTICNSRFAYRSAMLMHMAVQHRGGMPNKTKEPAKVDEFKCEIFSMSFYRKDILREHIKGKHGQKCRLSKVKFSVYKTVPVSP